MTVSNSTSRAAVRMHVAAAPADKRDFPQAGDQVAPGASPSMAGVSSLAGLLKSALAGLVLLNPVSAQESSPAFSGVRWVTHAVVSNGCVRNVYVAITASSQLPKIALQVTEGMGDMRDDLGEDAPDSIRVMLDTRSCEQPVDPAQMSELVASCFPNVTPSEAYDVHASLVQKWSATNVELTTINLRDTATPVPRDLNDPARCTLLLMNAANLFDKLVRADLTTIDWLASDTDAEGQSSVRQLRIVEPQLQSPPRTLQGQQRMFNMLEQAQDSAPTMLWLSSDYFNGPGFDALRLKGGEPVPLAERESRFVNSYGRRYAIVHLPPTLEAPDSHIIGLLPEQCLLEPTMISVLGQLPGTGLTISSALADSLRESGELHQRPAQVV